MVSRHRFLIDECLSPKLAEIEIEHADITHVNFRGLRGQPDAALARWCLASDHIVVTNNGRDFRTLYAAINLHPGVVIFLPSVGRAHQCDIFTSALPMLTARPDLVNTLVEIGDDGGLTFVDWPTP